MTASLFNTVAVDIRASPAAVWAVFQDRARWMDTFGVRTLVSGRAGETGMVAEVTMNIAGSALRREETLLSEPPRRWVVRITADGPAMAHADFHFDPWGDGCRVEASIHTWLGDAPDADLAAARDATQRKIAADFHRLRVVAEREAAGG